MKHLSKKDILSAPSGKTVSFEVPEWGGEVSVKSLNVRERDELGKIISDANDKGDNATILLAIIALTLVDKEGNQLFTSEEAEALADKSATTIENIAMEALKINGLGDKAVEEAEKN